MSFFEEYKKVKAKAEKFKGGDRDILDIYITRPASTFLLYFFRNTPISPNTITCFGILSAFIGSNLFIFCNQHWMLRLLGVAFIFLGLVFDGLDGQIARLHNKGSEFGAWFDFIGDNFRYNIIFLYLAIGFYFRADISDQWLVRDCELFFNNHAWILILGLWVIANFYLTYVIQGTRSYLSSFYGPLVKVKSSEKEALYVGGENAIYFAMITFLLFNQVYLLFLFFSIATPIFWMLLLKRTYEDSIQKSQSHSA